MDGACGGAVGWGTVLWAGRSWVRFLMVLLEFFIDIMTKSFWPHYGPGVNTASNRNEYQGYLLVCKWGWCVGLTTLPPSCADCLEIWKSQPPGTLRAWSGLDRNSFCALCLLERPLVFIKECFLHTLLSTRIMQVNKVSCVWRIPPPEKVLYQLIEMAAQITWYVGCIVAYMWRWQRAVCSLS